MKKLDFKNGIATLKTLKPREVYKWPLWTQALLGIILFFVILGLGIFFVVIDQYTEYQTEVDKETKLKTEFTDKTKQAVNLTLYKKQLVDITQASDELLKQLPNRAEVEKLLIDINQSGISRGLQFDLFKPNPEKLYEFYAELPISIRVTGSYDALGHFAADVSELSRVVLLRDISLTNNKDGTITMEATATTFRYLDPDELEKQKAAKKKAKAAATPKTDS